MPHSLVKATLISQMPYVIISSLVRVETGPTICGDETSDPELMKELGAELKSEPGNLV